MKLPPVSPAHIPLALATLTRLPVAHPGRATLADAAWAFPLVGLVCATVQALVVWGALGLGLTPLIAACAAVLTGVLITGALHEDGLADTADASGAFDRQRRLEIMRDSQIGTYGTLALIFSIGLRISALAALFAADIVWPALVLAAMLSRAGMALVMAALPHARRDGMSAHAGRPAPETALMGLAGASVIGTIFWVSAVVPALIIAVLCSAATGRYARTRIGGQTGDILGATQQIAECAVLVALVALL